MIVLDRVSAPWFAYFREPKGRVIFLNRVSILISEYEMPLVCWASEWPTYSLEKFVVSEAKGVESDVAKHDV